MQEYWSGLPCLPAGGLPNPGIELRSPTVQVDYLPSEPPGKPTNTGVGGLSLLQGSFLMQESKWGLLHCKQILYQLSTREAHPMLGTQLLLPDCEAVSLNSQAQGFSSPKTK